MSSSGQAFLAAYAHAKVTALAATYSLLDRLKTDPSAMANKQLAHAVEFASKAITIEKKIADEARAKLASVGPKSAEGTKLGQFAHALYAAWSRAERVAYLRGSADHPMLAGAASSLAVETQMAYADLDAELAKSTVPAIAKRRERLRKWIGVAPPIEATKSPSYDTLFAHIADWNQTLDQTLSGIAKDLDADATGHDPRPAMNLGARDVKGNGDELTIDVTDFLANAPALLASAPITRLHLRGSLDGRADALAGVAELGRITVLDLGKLKLTDDDLIALLKSPYLRQVRTLDLTENQITERGIDALAAATAGVLPALESVGLQLNKAHDPSDQLQFVDETTQAPVKTDAGKALEAKYGPLRWLHPHD